MDYLTKWPAVPDQSALTIARLFVEEVVSRHRAPQRSLSDREANFLSELVAQVCEILGV